MDFLLGQLTAEIGVELWSAGSAISITTNTLTY